MRAPPSPFPRDCTAEADGGRGGRRALPVVEAATLDAALPRVRVPLRTFLARARALLEAPGAVPAGHMLRAALAGGALSDQEAARVLLLHLQVLHLKPPAPAPSLLLPLPMSLLYTSSVDNS